VQRNSREIGCRPEDPGKRKVQKKVSPGTYSGILHAIAGAALYACHRINPFANSRENP
jgi:hypothetical protein